MSGAPGKVSRGSSGRPDSRKRGRSGLPFSPRPAARPDPGTWFPGWCSRGAPATMWLAGQQPLGGGDLKYAARCGLQVDGLSVGGGQHEITGHAPPAAADDAAQLGEGAAVEGLAPDEGDRGPPRLRCRTRRSGCWRTGPRPSCSSRCVPAGRPPSRPRCGFPFVVDGHPPA